MDKKRFALFALVSIVLSMLVQSSFDFGTFYYAGRDVLHGVNPYFDNIGYFNPIIVALAYAPLSLLRYDVAEHLSVAVMVMIYLIALSRIFKGRAALIAMLTPFTFLMARYNNIESLVLLGATLPAPIGVWLLIAKPQLGIFAAAILIIQSRSWKTGAACVVMLGISVLLGMGRSTPLNTYWNFSLFPWSLIVGLPLLYLAWRKRDQFVALGSALFITPYINIVSMGLTLPMFRRNWKIATIGAALSTIVFLIVWR